MYFSFLAVVFFFPNLQWLFFSFLFPVFKFVIYFCKHSKHGCFIMYLLILIYDAYENLSATNCFCWFLPIFPCLLVCLVIFDYMLISVLEKLLLRRPKMKEHLHLLLPSTWGTLPGLSFPYFGKQLYGHNFIETLFPFSFHLLCPVPKTTCPEVPWYLAEKEEMRREQLLVLVHLYLSGVNMKSTLSREGSLIKLYMSNAG